MHLSLARFDEHHYEYVIMSTYTFRSLKGVQDAEDRTVSELIHQSLISAVRVELFPKAVIDIFVTIIDERGSIIRG